MTSTLCLEIADAARLLANADFERFLGRRRLGAWLWEIVGEADDLAFGCFCNRIVGALAAGIVRRNLQLLDVGADHYRALVGGEVAVGPYSSMRNASWRASPIAVSYRKRSDA
jgi:hypothetical protein